MITALRRRCISLRVPASLRVVRGRSLRDTEMPKTRLLAPTLAVVAAIDGTTTVAFVATSPSVEGPPRVVEEVPGVRRRVVGEP